VAAGDELHYDFAFVSVPSVDMEGRILNGMTGEPVKSPNIMAYWGDKMSGITRKVDVNPKGDFKLDGIEPGPYTLIASAVENGENYYDLRVVEVGVAGLKDVQLALMPDFTANGEVKFENPEDRPQDSLPRRVSVEFMPMETNTGPFRVNADQPIQRRGASGNVKGVLAFGAKLHPGNSYRVSIVNLPQDYYLRSVLVDGHEVSASDVAIHGNGSELVLLASPAGGHIEGIVRDSKGQPVASHVVLAANVDQLTPDLVRSVRSDRQGKFVLRGVTPGDYKLYAWEQLDLNELLGQLDLLKEFEGACQLVHVDENGTYNPEIKVIATR
jgi:Carboxypeptidase regulatory-like domain